MQKVVGLGEVLWDITLPEEATTTTGLNWNTLPAGTNKAIGGAPANFAFHVSQFGYQGHIVSEIGNDPGGAGLLARLKQISEPEQYKSLIRYIGNNSHPTGNVFIYTAPNGEPDYTICLNTAWNHIRFTPQLAELAGQTKCVVFGTLAQQQESRQSIRLFLDTMPKENTFRIFDINLRQQYYSKEMIEESLTRCNILKINDNELKTVAGMFELTAPGIHLQCMELARRFKLSLVILTCGEKGSHIFTDRWLVSSVPAKKIKNPKVVGAGDSFTASFAAALMAGIPISAAHTFASEVAAFVCTKESAMPKFPPRILKKFTSLKTQFQVTRQI